MQHAIKLTGPLIGLRSGQAIVMGSFKAWLNFILTMLNPDAFTVFELCELLELEDMVDMAQYNAYGISLSQLVRTGKGYT